MKSPKLKTAVRHEGAEDNGLLPAGWRWVTLRDIAQIVGGITKGQRRRPNEVVRPVPYLRVANVQRGYLDLSEVKKIEATEQEIHALRLQPGDILFNEGGDLDKLGRGWVWRGELPECIHQNHVFRARLYDPENEPKFISWYGNSFGQQYFYDQGKHTTNLASINLTKLGALPIPLPPPAEQRRIVAEIEKQFTRLEAGGAALKRVQANLKRYRAAVLKDACEGRLVSTEAELTRQEGRTYEPAPQLLERILTERRKKWKSPRKYKEPSVPDIDKLPPLPEGWTWANLDQLLLNITDGDHQPPPQTNSGIPFLVIGNVRSGRINLIETRFVSREYADSLDPFRKPQKGDILYTLVGSFGLAVRVMNDDEFCIQRHIAILRPHAHSPVGFLSWILNSAFVFRQASDVATGTAQKTVPLAGLRRFAIPLPPLAEQARIVAEVERRLSVLEELESVVSANLQHAAALRHAILQQAFSGNLAADTERALTQQDFNINEVIRQQQHKKGLASIIGQWPGD